MLLLMLCCAAAQVQASAGEPRPEFRGFWVDGFQKGFKTPEQVDTLLQRVRQAHCNAIFAQMRKGGDAYYASHYEPWAHDDPMHFDALAYLIQKAHALQPPIQVHAWMNFSAVGSNRYHLPGHIATMHPEWLSRNTRLLSNDSEGWKIDPGVPDAADWTFRCYLDVVRHYAVDGIHFDYVRYGGRRWGYSEANLARFNRRYAGDKGIHRIAPLGLPDPKDETWKQWRRDQVTALVRKIYVHAVAINPHIVVSGALIAWEAGPHNQQEWLAKSAAMNLVFQDWRSWLQEGILDLGCPMTYFDVRHTLRYEQDWSAWIKAHQYGRAATAAVAGYLNTIPETLKLLPIARAPDASGHRPYGVMLYSYAGTNLSEPDARGRRHEKMHQPEFYAMLGAPSRYTHTPPFPTDVPIPPMSWKKSPTRGHVKGCVLTAQLQPEDGGLVTLEGADGRRLVRRTDGTGFYAFVDLPPGKYKLHVATPDGAGQAEAEVKAGEVQTANFTVGPTSPAAVASLTDLAAPQVSAASSPSSASQTPVRIENLTVLVGTDTYPRNLYVTDAHETLGRIQLMQSPTIPFQPGDIVSVVGVPAKSDGELVLDHATACLTGIAPMSVLPALTTLTGPESASRSSVGRLIKLEGIVTASNAEGLVLDDHGTRIVVPLLGRKDFGIESASFTVGTLPIGSRVRVTGLVTFENDNSSPKQLRIIPRSSEDIVALSSGAPLVGSVWGRWIVLILTSIGGVVLALYLWKRRRPRP